MEGLLKVDLKVLREIMKCTIASASYREERLVSKMIQSKRNSTADIHKVWEGGTALEKINSSYFFFISAFKKFILQLWDVPLSRSSLPRSPGEPFLNEQSFGRFRKCCLVGEVYDLGDGFGSLRSCLTHHFTLFIL